MSVPTEWGLSATVQLHNLGWTFSDKQEARQTPADHRDALDVVTDEVDGQVDSIAIFDSTNEETLNTRWITADVCATVEQ